ncbi:response regulator transcription factor [Xanthomonas sp. AM6]|uniref:response regulator transcription factor n=1 Tax=Xanthomonas sp. AM6 TaxID=2982531 RepID=UPI0021D8CAFD|nr:response regulator transcription factor [Xanthomonas sp. AM6]UYB53670.1 response regulator transcription factor [Xanthomonas sp. AM6]
MRILLVEDDPSLGDTLRAWLKLDGYTVDWLTRGDEARAALQAQPYQCVLLDRGLPGLDGDALLRTLRAARVTTPVLMITARDALEDRVQGLDLGADDYLVKPFDLEELSARIRSALRRSSGNPSVVLAHGDVELDPVAKRVTRAGEAVALTAREYAVLHALMARKGHIVGRDQLEDALYGWGEEVESNAIEVHISHLRKKLGSELIATIRRQGYCLGAPR